MLSDTIEMEELAREQEEQLISERKERGKEEVYSDPSIKLEDSGRTRRSNSKTREKDIEAGDELDDMAIMKASQAQSSEDKFLSGGNVTALVELDEYEREDDALVLTMKNIHKTYLLGVEGVPALRGVSLSVRKGEWLVIFGTSGGGKTSLLNIMGTIDKPTKGSMRIAGTRISKSTTDTELSDIRRLKLGFVFQTFNLLSSLSALENVMLPMILAGKYTAEERRKRATKLLRRVGMGQRLDHMPNMLSGGEQQRVTIARAIANSPSILLLDEPTGDLDTVNTLIVMKLLTDLNLKDKITLVMVTHELALKAFAERVVWMRDGKIQTVEKVPHKKRKDAFAKLEEDFKALKLDRSMFATGDENEDEEGKLSSAFDAEYGLESTSSTAPSPSTWEDSNEKLKSIKFRHTEIRQPTDYQQVKMIYGMKAERHKERERIAAAALLAQNKKGGHHAKQHHKQASKGKEKEEEETREKERADAAPKEGKLVDLSPDSHNKPADLLT